jgi:hypothetical protein
VWKLSLQHRLAGTNRFANMPGPAAAPAAYLNVEEYQIAFFCDNFFLLGTVSDITLGNISDEERDRMAVSLED